MTCLLMASYKDVNNWLQMFDIILLEVEAMTATVLSNEFVVSVG